MKKQFSIFLALFGVMISSCGDPKTEPKVEAPRIATKIEITSSWMNQEQAGKGKYQKIFLFALTNLANARQTVENSQAEAAAAKGVAAVKSSDVFPAGFFTNNPGAAAVIQKIKETGCDAVFTSALVNSNSETRFTPKTDSSFYMPYPTHAFYGTFSGYFGHASPFIYDPAYYANDKTYFVESNLYDIETGEIIWSVQSEVYNPGDLSSVSNEYAALLVDRLKEDGGLYRKK